MDMEIEKVWTVRSNWTKNEKESKIFMDYVRQRQNHPKHLITELAY